MTFVDELHCGTHTAYVYALGGYQRIAELAPLSSVRWQRIRDDVSVAEVTLPTALCCEVLAMLRTIKHELHIYRNGVVVWQGPITRLEYEVDTTRVYAEDVLWQAKRAVIEQAYSQAHPNIGNVLDRMHWLLVHCYSRQEDPWRMLPHLHPIYGPDDPRTTRSVHAWQMYVWEDFDKYAEDYGADYTVYNREIYFWDVGLRWMVLPPLDESHLSQYPRIVEYGNQLGTRGIVTNAQGYAGVSGPSIDAQVAYGAVIDYLTTNEPDGQPGLIVDKEGDVVPDPAAPDAPTAEELASWSDTAARSIIERSPAPVAVVIPANTTLLPGAPWDIEQLVPGAWFQVSTTRLCRSVTEWQRLQEVTVTEDGEAGEAVTFSAVSAPTSVHEPLGYTPPPWPLPPPYTP